MATTICKIAEQLNIAPSTVSRALKKPQLVSLETRDKVLQAAMKLGYLKQLRANCAIANIPEKKSLIGVIVWRIHEIVRGHTFKDRPKN